MTPTLGIDIGGTNLKWAVVDPQSRSAVESGSTQIKDRSSPNQLIPLITDLVTAVRHQEGGLQAVGIGLPGLCDTNRGVAVYLPNLDGDWRDYPVVDAVAEPAGIPVVIVNDVHALTLGELLAGAGQGARELLCVAIGTGVGGGLAFGGIPYLGDSGTAGAIGHTTVMPNGPRCVCGNDGCLEAVVNGAAIAKAAGYHSAEQVAHAARNGVQRAAEVLRQAGQHLAVAVANAITLFTPQRVVVGGGVAQAGELFLDTVNSEVFRRVRVAKSDDLRIVPSALGAHGGAIGAALWPAHGPQARSDLGVQIHESSSPVQEEASGTRP